MVNKNKETSCTKFKKVKKETTCFEMLRRVHLYDVKKAFSTIIKGDCYLMRKCIDKKRFYVVLVVFAMIIVAFQFMKNAFVILVGLEIIIIFVVVNV